MLVGSTLNSGAALSAVAKSCREAATITVLPRRAVLLLEADSRRGRSASRVALAPPP